MEEGYPEGHGGRPLGPISPPAESSLWPGAAGRGVEQRDLIPRPQRSEGTSTLEMGNKT